MHTSNIQKKNKACLKYENVQLDGTNTLHTQMTQSYFFNAGTLDLLHVEADCEEAKSCWFLLIQGDPMPMPSHLQLPSGPQWVHRIGYWMLHLQKAFKSIWDPSQLHINCIHHLIQSSLNYFYNDSFVLAYIMECNIFDVLSRRDWSSFNFKVHSYLVNCVRIMNLLKHLPTLQCPRVSDQSSDAWCLASCV